jgi:hypothetical protein
MISRLIANGTGKFRIVADVGSDLHEPVFSDKLSAHYG